MSQDGVELDSHDNHNIFSLNGKDSENKIFVSYDYSRRINTIEKYDGKNTSTLLSDTSICESNLSDENESSDDSFFNGSAFFPMEKKLYIIT